MQNVLWPVASKIAGFSLTVQAHSVGGAGRGGHYGFARGAGARWQGKLEVVPAVTATALAFRAFLHSLRGRAGTFLLQLPVPAITLPASLLSVFTDTTFFSDGTTFSDYITGLTAAASLDADEIETHAAVAAYMSVGDYVVIGDIETDGQLLRVVSIAGGVIGVRPRLRRAYDTGAAFEFGRVSGKFRLNEETPAVPLVGTHSNSLSVSIIEAY